MQANVTIIARCLSCAMHRVKLDKPPSFSCSFLAGRSFFSSSSTSPPSQGVHMKSSRLVTALVALLGLGAPAISYAGCDASCPADKCRYEAAGNYFYCTAVRGRAPAGPGIMSPRDAASGLPARSAPASTARTANPNQSPVASGNQNIRLHNPNEMAKPKPNPCLRPNQVYVNGVCVPRKGQ